MIETKRLIIKPLMPDELKLYVNSPIDLAVNMDLSISKSHINKESQSAILKDFLPKIEEAGENYIFYTMWVIIEKRKKTIVGGICFHGEPDKNKEVEIGYGIDAEQRNRGIMTETIDSFTQWIKKNIQVNSVRAKTDIKNYPSIKVLEKNGFKISEHIDNAMIFRLKLNL